MFFPQPSQPDQSVAGIRWTWISRGSIKTKPTSWNCSMVCPPFLLMEPEDASGCDPICHLRGPVSGGKKGLLAAKEKLQKPRVSYGLRRSPKIETSQPQFYSDTTSGQMRPVKPEISFAGCSLARKNPFPSPPVKRHENPARKEEGDQGLEKAAG